MNQKIRVAVYGTLRRGERNHRLLAEAKFIVRTRTSMRYTMLDINGCYPAITEGGRSSIAVEVFEVTSEQLASLDRLEGICFDENGRQDRSAGLYYRKRIQTRVGECWIYMMQAEKTARWAESIIESGDWINFRLLKKV